MPPSALSPFFSFTDASLETHLKDIAIKNPIGLAAGFDKNGEMISFLENLGFGFLEVGSITNKESLGNPKPRVFRLTEDSSLINRMGLPNWGAVKFAKHFSQLRTQIPVGINIAKTPLASPQQSQSFDSQIKDYTDSLQTLHQLGDYFVFNLSCPNSGDGKTFENPQHFQPLAKEIKTKRDHLKITKPVLIKLSPDLAPQDLEKIIEICFDQDFDGFVVSNTTSQREQLKTNPKILQEIGRGGLSGKGLTNLADKQLQRVFHLVGQKKIIIGVGGIMNFNDLLAKISAGASLVQVYTGFVYNGPSFVKQLTQQLAAFCKKQGVKNYKELIGQKF